MTASLLIAEIAELRKEVASQKGVLETYDKVYAEAKATIAAQSERIAALEGEVEAYKKREAFSTTHSYSEAITRAEFAEKALAEANKNREADEADYQVLMGEKKAAEAEAARLREKVEQMKKNHYSCCPMNPGTCRILEGPAALSGQEK